MGMVKSGPRDGDWDGDGDGDGMQDDIRLVN